MTEGSGEKDPIIRTYRQAKRLVRIVIGFTALVLGGIMLVTPGPGTPTIVVGLAILATEFVWARNLLNRFKNQANNIKNSFLNSINHKTGNSKHS